MAFGGEGFDGGDAAQVVGEVAVENADLLADGGVARLEGLLKTDAAPDNKGHGQHCHPGDFGGGVEENGADDDDGGDDLPDVVDADVEEKLELVDVVVEHGEQTARGAVFKVGEFEMLDVVVGVYAEVVLDGLGEVAPGDLIEVLEGGFEYPNSDGDAREDEELGARILNAEFGEERILLLNDDIDGGTDQERRGEVEEFVENGVEGGKHHRTAVRDGVVPEAGEGVGGL